MHRPEINLFQHPTTTVYIDDSTAFLYSITLGVDHQPFRSFSDPFAGLDYVDQYAHNYEMNAASRQDQDFINASKLGYNFALLAQNKLQNNARFAEPSVVVIDYSMPQLNGLDLCSRIQNPYVKKVLLTGVADEKIAITALNTELIDFYISKSEGSLSQELYRIIAHLQDRYFQDIYGWSKDSRLKELVPYLYNSTFADYFEDISEQLNIVEHYPLEDPWGFLLVSADGTFFHLRVDSDNEDQNSLSADQNSEAISIQPITIAMDNNVGPYQCSTHHVNFAQSRKVSGNAPVNVKSFTEYLQGPGLSIPIIGPHREGPRREH